MTDRDSINPATEDLAFDDLPPRSEVPEPDRTDPEPFIAAGEGETPDASTAFATGGELPSRHPILLAGDEALAFLQQAGVMSADAAEQFRGKTPDRSRLLSMLGLHGHTGLPDCPACAKQDAEDEEALNGFTEVELGPLVPAARVRLFELPDAYSSRHGKVSGGFALVVDNCPKGFDSDVRANWRTISEAMGARVLILSPEEIDLDDLDPAAHA
jgi:hypothetical protein